MSLRYIVPTLGLLAATTAPVAAADLGGLTVNGYVDTVLNLVSADEVGDSSTDFTSAAQLEVGYAIGTAVSANVEYRFDDNALEQAYVSYQVTDSVTLTMGKFHNWVGWEGLDAP
ncbi:MAG: hypothetical protein ACYTF0_09665, partial [Planctomycetota bacterium]